MTDAAAKPVPPERQGNRVWPECVWRPSDHCVGAPPAGPVPPQGRMVLTKLKEGASRVTKQDSCCRGRWRDTGMSVKGFVSLAFASFSLVRTIRRCGGTGPAADAQPSVSIGKCDCPVRSGFSAHLINEIFAMPCGAAALFCVGAAKQRRDRSCFCHPRLCGVTPRLGFCAGF